MRLGVCWSLLVTVVSQAGDASCSQQVDTVVPVLAAQAALEHPPTPKAAQVWTETQQANVAKHMLVGHSAC
jgi:hypothetical protein